MADGAQIAERAAPPGAVWDACVCCDAHRRLDDAGLCHACASDPLKCELVRLRAQVVDPDGQYRRLKNEHKRLQAAHKQACTRIKALRTQLQSLSLLQASHHVLPLTEDEYLALVSVMIDVREDEPTIPVLAICRKLEIDS